VDQLAEPIGVACGLAEIEFALWCWRREYVALGSRTTTIWPLILIHALHDLFLEGGACSRSDSSRYPFDTALLIRGIRLLPRAPDGSRLEVRRLASAPDVAVLAGVAPALRERPSER
jgi:hypothetical protein